MAEAATSARLYRLRRSRARPVQVGIRRHTLGAMPTKKTPSPAAGTATKATTSTAAGEPKAEKVQGPASYFPSIEKTYGRPISEWKALVRSSGISKHMEIVKWLKSEHAMGHGHANALVAHTLAEDSPK
jgi:Domain of unknown function (DUF4287)